MAIEQGDPAAQERLLIEVRPLDLSPGDRVVHELRVEMLHATRWSGAQQVARVAEVVGTLSAAGAHEQAMRLVDAIALRCFYGEPHPDTIARLVTAVGRAMGGSDDPMLPAYLAMISPVVHGREVRGRLRELLDRGGTDANLTHHLGMAASAVADFPASCAFHAVAAIGLRAQGRLGFLAHTQISHAMAALCLGDAQTATALLPEAEAIVREIGSPNWVPTALTTAGAACALRGDLAAAEERTTAAEAMLVSYGRNPLLALVRRARGLTALAGGRPAEALGEFRRVLDPADDSYHPYTGYLLAGHMAEAAAGCGDFGELRRLADELGPVADVSGSPALLAGLGYARAVLADTAEAWDKALGEDLPEWPFEQARRRHAYGAWLRRRRRPADSRPLLRAAAATFDALGATAWADRSRAELQASGESLRRPAQAAGRLTPQEALIARLAAEGLSNRDIAERLFLSPRTVTTHLSRIYPKLGIRSRSELARALGNT